MKIVADDKIPFLHGVLETTGCEVVYLPGAKITHTDLHDAAVLLTRTRTHCNRELLEGTSVQLVATATAGVDHINEADCAALGIDVANAPGCNADSVGQYVIASILLLAERHGFDPRDKVLGIIGAGHTGQAVLKYANALGMKTILKDPPRAERDPSFVSATLEETLSGADIITFHTPLTARTRALANDIFFRQMKPGSFFINAARGEIVEPHALASALLLEHLAGAVLDVWPDEPNVDPKLFTLMEIGTPHIAGYAADGKWNATRDVVRAVSRKFNLGLDDWCPPPLPFPDSPLIDLAQHRGTALEVLTDAVIHAYDPTADHARLASDLSAFEQRRNSYPNRRAFDAYAVRLPAHVNAQVFCDFGFAVRD